MELYVRLALASIRSRLQYKLDFVVTMLLYGLMTTMDFLLAASILLRYHQVSGWNLHEVALLSGIASASFGLFRVFGSEIYAFERYLVAGEFDSLLIRPWPSLAALLSRNFDLGRMGGFLQGLLVLTIGLRGVLAQGAPAWLALYAYLMPVAGAAVIGAISLAVAAAGFWTTRIDELQTFAVSAPYTASQFPADIFPAWLRGLLTAVLPVTAYTYFPMRYALGKGGTPLALLSPFLVAALAVWVGLRLWQWGERHYQSTGN